MQTVIGQELACADCLSTLLFIFGGSPQLVCEAMQKYVTNAQSFEATVRMSINLYAILIEHDCLDEKTGILIDRDKNIELIKTLIANAWTSFLIRYVPGRWEYDDLFMDMRKFLGTRIYLDYAESV